ncbi:unnamed protein product, partial [Urochloa humidicola]
AAVPAASGCPAGCRRVAVVGRLRRRGRRRHHDALAAAAGDRVAVPVLPGAAGWGLHGALPLDDAAAAAGVAGDVPSRSGVPPVGGAPRQQRGGVAATARCALCFLGAMDVSV